MQNLRDLTYEDLLSLMESLGEKPYRAQQVYGWVYHRGAASIDSMTDVSKALRERLKGGFYIGELETIGVRTSSDGTRKFLSRLEDGERVESVLIPEAGRLTLCVSTQAGCALGCGFCMTGKVGFRRNLKLSELVGEVFSAQKLLAPEERITNVVLMGMGEPLLNYGNVVSFLRILIDPKGLGFSHNKVTVSTAGIVPMIRRLAKDSSVNLAVSLNATTDEVRSLIMPVNRKYPMGELLKALREYPLTGKRHITIEYVLIKGVNDSDEDARRLVRLLRGIPCKINLIPLNPFEGSPYSPPDPERINSFHKLVMDAGYTVIVRASKGQDIEAACGQLRASYPGVPS